MRPRSGARRGPANSAVSTSTPVFLVIYSGDGSKQNHCKNQIDQRAVNVCQGEAEMMRAIKADFGLSTIFQIVRHCAPAARPTFAD